MDMRIYFPGGKKVYADFNGFTHQTDQPGPQDQKGSAPTPFDLFLASLGACAGFYMLSFCQQRSIDTRDLELRQSLVFNPQTHLVETVNLEILVPATFPEKYRAALVQSAQLCTVKKHLEKPPRFNISTRVKTAAD